jgi:hypothetical protein
LLNDFARDWKDERNHIIGHVTLSPPISFDYDDECFIGDGTVIEIYCIMITKLNFVQNVIDLGFIAVNELTAGINSRQSSFKYLGNRLLHFCGLVSDEEVFKPSPKANLDHDNVMVMKNGSASNFTIGRLKTIPAFVRTYSIDGQPGKIVKEVCVLPRNSKSGWFSAHGDSGSVVIDGID